MKVNRVSICVMFTVLILLLAGCGKVSREKVMKEVKSTNLSKENIDGIWLGKSINNVDDYGQFVPLSDNKHYATVRNFDQYQNNHIIMSVDRNTSEILQIGTIDKNKTSTTANGIKNGMTIDKVISTYGENYFSFKDKEQSINVIGYVDHKNNLELSFAYLNEKVIGISLNYAFDRLKWKKDN